MPPTRGNTDATPYRRTHIRFDDAEPMLAVRPFAVTRDASQIVPSIATPAGGPASVGVEQVRQGPWIMSPAQKYFSTLTERNTLSNTVVNAALWALVPTITSRFHFRAPTNANQPGLTTDTGVPAQGDEFLTKRVGAGVTWAQTLQSDVDAYGQPVLNTHNVPMYRVGVTKSTLLADQAFLIRFASAGAGLQHADSQFTFYFGGATMPDGSGQFCLNFTGSGRAYLFERINNAWVFRREFQYQAPVSATGAPQSIRILPYRSADNRTGYIEFVSGPTDTSVIDGGNTRAPRPVPIAGVTSSRYEFQITGNRPNITGAGLLRLDMRADLRVEISISRLAFTGTSVLYDAPFYVPEAGSGAAMQVSWQSARPGGASIVGRLYDATTFAELSFVSRTTNSAIYLPNAGQSLYIAGYQMTGGGPAFDFTPALYAYSVTQAQNNATSPVTPREASALQGSYIQRVSIVGPERDITHETASFAINDLTNSISQLNTRSAGRVTIETEYDPSDSTKRSVLFHGYANHNSGRRRGTTTNEGIGGAGRTKQYPSPGWRDYDCMAFGMWQRLAEQFPPGIRPLIPGVDKITDLIILGLRSCGFPDTMIDVPDNPLTIFPAGSGANGLTLEPTQSWLSIITAWVSEYLGATFRWDANAGTAGMWRVSPVPVAPYTPLAIFHSNATVPNVPVHLPGAYGSTNWVSQGGAVVHSFIRRDSLRSHIVQPESTTVEVVGASPAGLVRNSLTNPDYNNPASVDYTGRIILYRRVDLSLGPDAVNFFTRRLYDIGTHGTKIFSFDCPLVLVTDPTDKLQRNPRPLRYYDPITLITTEGTAPVLVRSCSPVYKQDAVQYCTIEAEVPRV